MVSREVVQYDGLCTESIYRQAKRPVWITFRHTGHNITPGQAYRVLYEDRSDYLWFVDDNGKPQIASNYDFAKGNCGHLYHKKNTIRCGGGDLMGRIGLAIRSGKAFKGR